MARIDAVDMYYFRLPDVQDIGDGGQDMVLVRLESDGHVGWGECEASPLPTLAALIAPLSHSACHPVIHSVRNAVLDGPDDIRALSAAVRANSFDLLQADHVLSGIEIAAWDLLGRRHECPVHELMGQTQSVGKIPYASVLFGDTPRETHERAHAIRAAGYRAAKFGWGTFGMGSVSDDEEQLEAARSGLGEAIDLMVDAGTVFGENVDEVLLRMPALKSHEVVWLEEPLTTWATTAYARLSREARVPLAAGEGLHHPLQAIELIRAGGISFVQVDTGRIGGINDSRRAQQAAQAQGVQFVNHTFTTHLALSASLQPYADDTSSRYCEYPFDASELARAASLDHIKLDENGLISAPDAPGLGITPDLDALAPYLVDVSITVNDDVLYTTPDAAGLTEMGRAAGSHA